MKLLIGIVAVVLLLLAGYYIRPDIDAAVGDYWANRIDQLETDTSLTTAERRDSLLVVSLNMRAKGRMDLARRALAKVNALVPGSPVAAGLLGLYDMQAGNKPGAIEAWRQGAQTAPDDPNLSYLATLDTADIAYLDANMLEKMFVDSLVNSRLQVGLYHGPDNDVVEGTARKIRVEGAIDRTFVVTGIAAVLVLWWSISRIIRMRRRRSKRGDPATNDAAREEEEKESGVTRPIHYMVAISSLLKIGQVLAALFNYFMLGTDISGFVSDYVFTPSNLFSLFTENLMFAVIFIVIIGTEIVRRTMFAGSAAKA